MASQLSPYTCRISTPGGSFSCSATTLGELVGAAAERMGLPVAEIAISVGFPPALLAGPSAATLSSLGLLDRVKVTARPRNEGGHGSVTEAAGPASPATAVPPTPPAAASVEATQIAEVAGCVLDVAEALFQAHGSVAAALSFVFEGGALPVPVPASAAAAARSSIGGTMRLKKISADNSCLFASVAHLVWGDASRAAELRRVCADAIVAAPLVYTASMLGRPASEYASWIVCSTSWGGEIECAILAAHLRTHIVVHDVQHRGRLEYGEGPWTRAAHIVYSGIHYDALECADGDGGVLTTPRGDAACEAEVAAIVGDLNESRQFTKVEGMTIQCAVCRKSLKGMPQASAHAHATGHDVRPPRPLLARALPSLRATSLPPPLNSPLLTLPASPPFSSALWSSRDEI